MSLVKSTGSSRVPAPAQPPVPPKAAGRPLGKLISVANMKGGVAKTTTSITLAEALVADDPKRRVLIVDFDPQASASVTVAGDDALDNIKKQGLTLDEFIKRKWADNENALTVERYIHAGLTNTYHQNKKLSIYLLPTGPDLRYLERDAIYQMTLAGHTIRSMEIELSKILRECFSDFRSKFDYIIVDCPPSPTMLVEAVIAISDMIITPTVPDQISAYGMTAFIESVLGGYFN